MQGFRYLQKSKTYKASNNYLDVQYMQAVSYDWWVYFKQIDGLNVFNAYPYSPSTRRHQNKMKRLLEYLSIPIDVEVSTKYSLDTIQDTNEVLHALYTELSQIDSLLSYLVRETSGKRTRLKAEYARILDTIQRVKQHKAS